MVPRQRQQRPSGSGGQSAEFPSLPPVLREDLITHVRTELQNKGLLVLLSDCWDILFFFFFCCIISCCSRESFDSCKHDAELAIISVFLIEVNNAQWGLESDVMFF